MKRVWIEIFLELAIRAITQIHHKYNVWQLGQEDLAIKDFKKLNQGQGIYYAPEEHVRDGISQQIIETGIWKEHKINGQVRSYLIDREFQIKIPFQDMVVFDKEQKFLKDKSYYKEDKDWANCKKRKCFNVDIVFKRIQEENKDRSKTIPTFIEAKRYKLVDVNLITKKVKIGKIQKKGIDSDILKLRVISRYVKRNGIRFHNKIHKKVYTYLLIWGEGDELFDLKKDLIQKLKYSEFIDTDRCVIRRVPMKWGNTKKIKVKSFIWISLLPVLVD